MLPIYCLGAQLEFFAAEGGGWKFYFFITLGGANIEEKVEVLPVSPVRILKLLEIYFKSVLNK